MNKSLYSKLVLIMLVLILSLMSVVAAFLMNEIKAFYLSDFYAQMKTVFESTEFWGSLDSAANDDAPVDSLDVVIATHSGQLGIDTASRNYYILSGSTGEVLSGSGPEKKLDMTANIMTALTGETGDQSDQNAPYMDVAVPVAGDHSNYIIYINDNKSTVYGLSDSLFEIIIESLFVGLAISVVLSLLLAKTIVTPIQKLTVASEKVASGDFSQKPETGARDEIGVLTHTFNDMAGQLETTLDSLTKSEAMRREFVANVSHELRTPITSIRSYAETLQASPGIAPDTQSEFLGVIVNESDRMTKIVQDLLTLSRFDAGSYEFNFGAFSIEDAINNVYNAMLLEAQKYNHSFKVKIRNALPEIIGDKARIEQVLINMVSNAVKYTREGGKISISAQKIDKSVQISVIDNGIGIPEEDLPKVLDRFYRVDKARSRESGGTGLGLSIANEIVAKHQGKLELQSHVGNGTTITVTLPVEGPNEK